MSDSCRIMVVRVCHPRFSHMVTIWRCTYLQMMWWYITFSRACLAPTAMSRMPFFADASGFIIKDSHMSEVGGDYFNIDIHFAMPAESTGWFGISMFKWSYWTKCPERIATQLLGKRKERDLDKGDAEGDGPIARERYGEVCDETLDGLMVRI